MSLEQTLARIPDMSPSQRARLRANAVRWLVSGTELQQDQAREVIEALDAREEAERQGLAECLATTPLAARVAEAFRIDPPTETEEKVLCALLDYPGSTSAALSRACGWGGQSWHMHFGKMAEKREARLWPVQPVPSRDSHFFSGILADFDWDGARFTMKPEVAEGLAEIGIVAQGGR